MKKTNKNYKTKKISKMATVGFQNVRRGLERGLFLDFWALQETFAKDILI